MSKLSTGGPRSQEQGLGDVQGDKNVNEVHPRWCARVTDEETHLTGALQTGISP